MYCFPCCGFATDYSTKRTFIAFFNPNTIYLSEMFDITQDFSDWIHIVKKAIEEISIEHWMSRFPKPDPNSIWPYSYVLAYRSLYLFWRNRNVDNKFVKGMYRLVPTFDAEHREVLSISVLGYRTNSRYIITNEEFADMVKRKELRKAHFKNLIMRDGMMLEFDWTPLITGKINDAQSLRMSDTYNVQKRIALNVDNDIINICMSAIYYKIWQFVQKKSTEEPT